jgi:hypothetical protein
MLDLGASGAFRVASLFCVAPNMLWKPEELAAGVAAGVLAGFESPANGFGLGVSAVLLLDSSGFLRALNKLVEAVGVFACA